VATGTVKDDDIREQRKLHFVDARAFACFAPLVNLAGGAAGNAVGESTGAAGFALTKVAGGAITSRVPVTMNSAAAGTPAWTVVTGLNLWLPSIVAAGDTWQHLMEIPAVWDRGFDIRVRPIWTSAAAAVGARTLTFIFLYQNVDPTVTALAAPTTALNTVLVAHAPRGTSLAVERTNNDSVGVDRPGVITGKSLSSGARYLHFTLEADAIDAAFVEAKWLMGVEFEYTPKYTAIGRTSEAPAFAA
jgi:hypothetical protein